MERSQETGAWSEQLATYADLCVDHISIYAQPMTAAALEWLAPVLDAVRHGRAR